MAIWSRLQGTMFGVGIGAAARDAVAPVLETARQSSYGQRAVYVLNATVAARASVRGLVAGVGGIRKTPNYADDAKRQGVGFNRFEVLKALEVTFPGTDQILTWYRRQPSAFKTPDPARVQAAEALKRLGYDDEWTARLLTLARVPVPASDLIRMAVREVFSPGLRDRLNLDADFPTEVLDPAAEVGLSSEAMRNYWAAHWDLPSYTQLTEMLHRGELTPAQYDDALRAADYAPTWRGKLKAIAVRIAPISDMIRFAVRDVYDDQRRTELGLDAEFPQAFADAASLHGQTEETSRQYWAAHWRLPSAMQGYRMRARKEIGDADLMSLLKALDYPPLWRKRLFNIRFLVPGRIDLRRMRAVGMLSLAETTEGYEKLGYSPDDAKLMAQLAEPEAVEKAKTLTAESLAREYEANLLTNEQYVAALREIGYTEEAAGLLLVLASRRLVTKAREQRLARIRTSYVGHKIQRTAAQLQLEEAGFAVVLLPELLDEWDAERAVNVTRLTAAQVKAAWKKAILTLPQTLDELVDRGYSSDEAYIFLGMKPGETIERMTAAQVKSAYEKNTVTLADAIARLALLGYSEADARTYLGAPPA